MAFKGGWCGTLIRVNLNTGEIRKEPLREDLAWDYIGGRGMGAKLLYDMMPNPAAVDAFAPENPLMFLTGPLTGTFAPTGARYVVVTKSPLTGTIGVANSGGYFGAELKFAGYDGVIFEGISPEPVYLWIEDDKVELRSAKHLWGKTVSETDDAIKAEAHPDAKVACIGPAGENKVLMAAVLNDKHRAAGRNGVGAAMGNKRVKAVAVRGTKGFTVARLKEFMQAVNQAMQILRNSEITAPKTSSNPDGGVLAHYGTAALVAGINAHGLFPTRNFQTGVLPTANNIGGEAIAEKILVRNKGCFACSISCGRSTKIKEGKYAGKTGEGPEYEVSWALGGDTGVDDLGAVTYANYLCNDLGMDPISVGGTIACAMELYEKGYIPHSDIQLRFGDPDALVAAVEAIAYRRGIGDEMAEGSYRLASKYGHPEFSISVKKQELAAYDPRGAKGMALTYGTSPRGACHLKSYTIAPEILLAQVDPLTEEGKAAIVKQMQDATAFVDSSGMCLFTTFAMVVNDFVPLINTCVGADWNADELMMIGERIFNLERLFNMKAGFGRKDDDIPERLKKEPMPEGAAKGQVVNYEPMLDEWYRLRGWDNEGRPTQEKLRALGLVA